MVQLLPVPTSAGEARRVVTARVVALGRPELVDDVVVVVSELVTNAVIHAQTSIELSVRPVGAGVRVEVSDGSPLVPQWAPAAMYATSGRGLIIVQRLAEAWGVERRPGGKTVWAQVEARIDPVPESSFEELLALWSEDEPAPAPPSPGDLARVVLTVDVQQMLDSRAHTEGLVRELQLMVSSGSTEAVAAPVVQLAHRLEATTEAFHDGRRQMLRQTLVAAKRGDTSVTLELRLHRDDGEAARHWLAALDEADSLTGLGVLLLPPFSPALVSFRRDYIAAIVRGLEES